MQDPHPLIVNILLFIRDGEKYLNTIINIKNIMGELIQFDKVLDDELLEIKSSKKINIPSS